MKWILSITGLIAVQSFAGPITLLQNHHSLTATPIGKVVSDVKKYIDTGHYSKVAVQPMYKNGKIAYILAYLASKNTYSFKTVKLTVNSNYKVLNVTSNYQLTRSDCDEQPNTPNPTCPDDSIQFISATPIDGSTPTNPYAAMEAGAVNSTALNDGYTSKLIIGSDATVSTYENYLSCPKLKGFYNIGDGENKSILLSNGVLCYTELEGPLKNKLNENAVVVFNSCNTFGNDYLEPAIINNMNYKPEGLAAQKFVGGQTALYINDSEYITACFWKKALAGAPMSNSLNQCVATLEKDHSEVLGLAGYGSDIINKA